MVCIYIYNLGLPSLSNDPIITCVFFLCSMCNSTIFLNFSIRILVRTSQVFAITVTLLTFVNI